MHNFQKIKTDRKRRIQAIACIEKYMSEKKENPAMPEGKVGETMLKRMNVSHEPLRSFGLPLIPWREGMRILDVGCGGGATIAEMLQLSKGSIIDGIDYSEVSVEQSRMLNKEYIGTRCNISQADVTKLPFEDHTFDLVTAVETVYFWPEIEKAFAEIKRVLKPGGVFVILNEGSDPDNIDWPEIDSFMVIYRPQELEDLVKKSGFDHIQLHHGPDQLICLICCK